MWNDGNVWFSEKIQIRSQIANEFDRKRVPSLRIYYVTYNRADDQQKLKILD